jgi:hypothetical protein
MSEGSTAQGAPEPSLIGVMPDVVRGLKDKPALLFGIGAGIVLVVVLGVTSSVWLVLIVAAVLVLSLGAWLFTEARRQRDAAVTNVVQAKGSRIRKSDVGVVDTGPGSVANKVDVSGADVSGSNVGVVGSGSRRRRRTKGS